MTILKFKCSKCAHKTIEAVVENAVVYSTITVEANGNYDYGHPVITNSDFMGFQCTNCGTPIVDGDGHSIMSEQELAEWLLKQPYNKVQNELDNSTSSQESGDA